MGRYSTTYLNDIKFAIFTTSTSDMDYDEFVEFYVTKMRLIENCANRIKALFYENVGGESFFYVGTNEMEVMNELKRICRADGSLKFLRHRDEKIFVTTYPECTAILKKIDCQIEGKALKVLHKKDFDLSKTIKLLINDYGANLNEKISGFLHFNDRTFIQSNDTNVIKTLLNVFINRKIKCMIVYEITAIDFKPYGDKEFHGEASSQDKTTQNEIPVKQRLGPVPITIETYRKRRAEEATSDDSDTQKRIKKAEITVQPESHETPINDKTFSIPLATSTMIGSAEITSVKMCQIGVLDISKLGSGKWKIIAVKEED